MPKSATNDDVYRHAKYIIKFMSIDDTFSRYHGDEHRVQLITPVEADTAVG